MVIVHEIWFPAARTAFLDQEWFTFETVGTLVVGWEGGPSRLGTRQDQGRAQPSAATQDKPGRASGIEIAAAAATGGCHHYDQWKIPV